MGREEKSDAIARVAVVMRLISLEAYNGHFSMICKLWELGGLRYFNPSDARIDLLFPLPDPLYKSFARKHVLYR